MTDSTNSDHPAEALARLIAFAEQYEPGEVIDEASGLTADDLDALIKRVEIAAGLVAIRSIDMNQLGSWPTVR